MSKISTNRFKNDSTCMFDDINLELKFFNYDLMWYLIPLIIEKYISYIKFPVYSEFTGPNMARNLHLSFESAYSTKEGAF